MRRLGAVALLVAGASGVVAIGATGAGLLLPPANLSGGWALAVRVAAAAAVVAGSVGLLVQRRRLKSNADRHYDPTVAALVAAAMIMGVLALIARIAPAPEAGPDADQEDTAATHGVVADDERSPTTDSSRAGSGGGRGGFGLVQAGRDRRVPQQGEDESDVDFDRSILRRVRSFILPLALLGVAVLGLLALKGLLGRRREEPPADTQVAAVDAEAALEASLTDVAYDGPDPRRQITTAYQRLLAALAAAGAPREPQEAPHEHLNRTLGPLGVQPEPMHTLTELHVVAQFSERPITEQHRVAATEALEAGLVSLRATNGEPGTDAADSTAERTHA